MATDSIITGRIICILAIIAVLASLGSAVSIKSVETKPATLTPTSKFTIKANLGGETCGMQLKFYIDDREFDSKNIGCEANDAESDQWDLNKDPLDCGIHYAKVEIEDGGKVVQSQTKELRIGNVPKIAITPEQPIPQAEAIITFKDPSTGSPISDLDVNIFKIKDGASSAVDYSSDGRGQIKFISSNVAEYRLRIVDSKYCGEMDFWIKRVMPFQGPIPANPVVGERIGIAVPNGVGVRYIDAAGNSFPQINMGGGVNITIDKPGTYKLIAGEISTVYWMVVKNFTVTERNVMKAAITPEKAVADRVVLLTITANGAPVANTIVKITKPVGGLETLETNAQGEVRFTPTSVGKHHYTVEKARHATLDGDFDVANTFDVAIEPREPIANQDVTLKLTDQRGMPVDGALVFIEDTTGIVMSEVTGLDGTFKFRIEEPKEYTVKAQKEGYWGYEEKISIFGIIAIELDPEEIEIGENITILVTDIDNKEVPADISAVKPSGRTDSVSGTTYKPPEVGNYTVKASKARYKTVSAELKVNPHPLDLSDRIENRKLVVKATSHGKPVAGITIVMVTPTEQKEAVTDENGTVTARVESEGDLSISANTIEINREYESKDLKRNVVKQYDYPLLLVPAGFVVATALLIIILIDLAHRYKQRDKKGGGLFKGKGGGFKPPGGKKSSLFDI